MTFFIANKNPITEISLMVDRFLRHPVWPNFNFQSSLFLRCFSNDLAMLPSFTASRFIKVSPKQPVTSNAKQTRRKRSALVSRLFIPNRAVSACRLYRKWGWATNQRLAMSESSGSSEMVICHKVWKMPRCELHGWEKPAYPRSRLSKTNCSEGQMRAYSVTREPHYDADATVVAPEPY